LKSAYRLCGWTRLWLTLARLLSVLEPAIPSYPRQQIAYAIQVMQHMQLTGITSVEPKADVEKEWHEKHQEGLKPTIWNIDCGGWYKHKVRSFVFLSWECR